MKNPFLYLAALLTALAVCAACSGVNANTDGSATVALDARALTARSAKTDSDSTTYAIAVTYAYDSVSRTAEKRVSYSQEERAAFEKSTTPITLPFTIDGLPLGQRVTFSMKIWENGELLFVSQENVTVTVQEETAVHIALAWYTPYALPKDVRYISSTGEERTADGTAAHPYSINALADNALLSTDAENPTSFALLDDIEITKEITIPAETQGTYVSLYLNGHRIIRNVTNSALFSLKSQFSPNLTIYGGATSRIDGNKSVLTDVTQPLFQVENGTLTLQGVTITHAAVNHSDGAATVLFQKGGLAQLKDCTITNCTSTEDLFESTAGLLILDNTEIKNSGAAKYIFQIQASGATVILTNGSAVLNSTSITEKESTGTAATNAIAYVGGTLAITGASISTQLPNNSFAAIYVADYGKLFIGDSYEHTENGKPTEYTYTAGENKTLVYAFNGYAINAPSSYKNGASDSFSINENYIGATEQKITWR